MADHTGDRMSEFNSGAGRASGDVALMKADIVTQMRGNRSIEAIIQESYDIAIDKLNHKRSAPTIHVFVEDGVEQRPAPSVYRFERSSGIEAAKVRHTFG